MAYLLFGHSTNSSYSMTGLVCYRALASSGVKMHGSNVNSGYIYIYIYICMHGYTTLCMYIYTFIYIYRELCMIPNHTGAISQEHV